jgi:hypothetical protein
MRDPVTLAPGILAMHDRHEPDKTKQARLLTEHLARQGTLPSTEEELEQHLERKAKRKADKLLAAKAKLLETAGKERIKQEEAARQAQNATLIATFSKRAK